MKRSFRSIKNYRVRKEHCEDKVRYLSPMDALISARRQANRRGRLRHNIYLCQICDHYHLTSKRKHKKKEQENNV